MSGNLTRDPVISVVLTDDHAVVRAALRALLDGQYPERSELHQARARLTNRPGLELLRPAGRTDLRLRGQQPDEDLLAADGPARLRAARLRAPAPQGSRDGRQVGRRPRGDHTDAQGWLQAAEFASEGATKILGVLDVLQDDGALHVLGAVQATREAEMSAQ